MNESKTMQISAETAIEKWHASRLSVTKIYEMSPEIIKAQDSVIGTLGNFSASIGKAKSKKTFNVLAIVAAALTNGTVLRYSVSLPEGKRRVLYIDIPEPHHRIALEAAFSKKPSYGYKELTEVLQETYGLVSVQLSNNKAVALISMLKCKRMIVQDASKKYIYNPDFVY